jgi:hypothetical protein
MGNLCFENRLKLLILSNYIFNGWNFVGSFSCEHKLSQPYFGQVWGWSPTLGRSEELESFGAPECLELDSKAQNTSHWGVLGVIGKVLKRRYRKWHRIGHLDICRPSYGQKKGRESNWQFDSRPLKAGNRYVPDLWIESAIRRWKDDDEGYKFGSDLVAIRLRNRELWAPKVPGLHPGLHSGKFRDNFGTAPWESREKKPFGCSPRNVAQRILYGGRWWLPPSLGRGVSLGPKCPWLVPTPKGVPECELTTWVVCFDADSCLIY